MEPSASETSVQYTHGTATRPLQQGRTSSSPDLVASPSLASFEAVMQAMDAELARIQPNAIVQSQSTDKGKGKAATPATPNADIEAAMDAELRVALETERDGDDDYGVEDDGGRLDYNLIKNFLESFKSQGGLSGPVGNLAGRLQPEWQLPRDES